MEQKTHLPARLEPELLERLRSAAASLNAPIPETISLALDALDKEEYLTERLENKNRQVSHGPPPTLWCDKLFPQERDTLPLVFSDYPGSAIVACLMSLPWTMKITISAMLVAWSAIRSRKFDMEVMLMARSTVAGSSIMKVSNSLCN